MLSNYYNKSGQNLYWIINFLKNKKNFGWEKNIYYTQSFKFILIEIIRIKFVDQFEHRLFKLKEYKCNLARREYW